MTTLSSRKRKIREDKKPACDACRAHKLRCDASLDYSQPCARCRRRQIECVVQEHRRKKMTSGGTSTSQNITSHAHTQGSSHPPMADQSHGPISNAIEPILIPILFDNSAETETRTIGDVCVEGSKIDICFARFYRYFAPLLPILSVQLTPNQTFQESQLKFWVITTIGSRKCLEDPTLFSVLSPHVETLALQSLRIGLASPYSIVEAYLLMCNFHLSTDLPFYRSVYSTLSTAIVPLTLQTGMHPCFSLQHIFSSKPHSETERGAKLWAYAAISAQTNMALHGYSIGDPDALRHLLQGCECCATLPGQLVTEARMLAHIARLYQMIYDSDLESDARKLRSIVSVFEAELFDLQNKTSLDDQGPLTGILFAILHLQVLSLMFLAPPTNLDRTDLLQIAQAAITTMTLTEELDSRFQISIACPDFVFQGLQLAGSTMIRLLKGYASQISFCEKDMTRAVFSAINISKTISVANNDIPAKVSEILTQLWHNPRLYRDADDAVDLRLHVRSRLSMNVVLDCLYWFNKLHWGFSKRQTSHQYSEYPPKEGVNISLNLPGVSQANDPESGGVGELAASNSFFFDDWETWGFDWDISESLQFSGIPHGESELQALGGFSGGA